MAIKERIFGHIPGIEVGFTFENYAAMNAAGIHRPTQAGISGSGKEGADSIVISGGYEDDQDFGDEIIYTGHGGKNTSGHQIADQTLTLGNLALARSQIEGLPVRIIRGAHKHNPYAPKKGYRYDGLYRVDSYWHEKGKSGFLVWRYRLLQINTEEHIPQEQEPSLHLGTNLKPTRQAIQTQRIVRDTKQAKDLKNHYDHECQVCGTTIMTAAGPYAEAAHIRPLGEPHNGPDTTDNIICLCPNHHVMFDHGTFSIADDLTLIGIEGKLNVTKQHKLNLEFIRYHRAHYLSKIEKL